MLLSARWPAIFKQYFRTRGFLTKTSILCLLFQTLHAYEPYHAKVAANSTVVNISAPNLVDLNRELKAASLAEIIPGYTPTTAIAFGIDLRGLKAITFFPANSTTLFVEIPDAAITETFTGATRDESLTLFKEFIKEGASLEKLLRAYCRHSPIDPIAGNPTSLMSLMAESDYLLGQLSPFNGCDCRFNTQPVRHQFQAGLDLSRATVKKFDSTQLTFPLRYSYSPCNTWAFIVDAPLQYIRNGGASSLVGSLGIGWRLPLTSNWSLTSIARVGSGGSLDLCTSGSFVSVGAVSSSHYKISHFVLSINNYAGYVSSANLWLTGVNFNYHLHNVAIKNGISIFSCNGLMLCDRAFHIGAEIKDTYFAGSKLFIRHYDEFALNVTTTHINRCLAFDCLTTQLAYQFGEKGFKGYRLNFIYQF
ncbi:hypothetical protein [Estrella lausannensis]|uniref:Uncharacterized protein n=1 Tax=Estrella lausannensis TaxID=483423 RepID=A0A0H5E2F7_9BACT|nr:hypothetical protein [Estrella lausannensis]CRX37370.1 hypothetical protein ELAC_0006 [Estrella lausannensis]